MRTRATVATIGLGLILFLVLPADTLAQRRGGGRRGMLPPPQWTFEVYAGLANFGRFLEQDVLVAPLMELRERELRADDALALGGAVAYSVPLVGSLRLGFTWASTELRYEDDTGDGGTVLDRDDLADLTSSTIGLEVIRYLFGLQQRVAPYIAGGITGTFWSLGDAAPSLVIVNGEQVFGVDEIVGEDDTEFRLGGVGALGVQWRLTPQFGLRLEVASFSLGNPFDGEESFFTTTGLTFDEPTRVRQTVVSGGVTYTIPRRR